jgi:hypothetical protein
MKTNNKLRLYLDDVRTPIGEDWVLVRNYEQFVSQIRLFGIGNFEVISLDHDLGDTAMIEYYTNVKNNYNLDYNNILEKTGYDAAKFLVAESMNTRIPLPQIYIHSANPIGSANIMGYINNYLKNCKLPPSCINVNIEHTIDEQFMLSPEVRKARWDKSGEK